MNEQDIEQIEQNIIDVAKRNNWILTKNVHNIAKAKCRMFGLKEWRRCPCYPKDDKIHGCETEACTNTINENGVCHCNLFLKNED